MSFAPPAEPCEGVDGERSYNRANAKESVHICATRHSGDRMKQGCGTGGEVYTDTIKKRSS